MLEKYVYEAENLEEAVRLSHEDIRYEDNEVYSSHEEKDGKVVLTIVRKDDVSRFIKYYIKTMGNLMCLLIDLEVSREDDIYNVKMASNNNPILIGKEGRTLNAIQVLVRQTLKNQLGLSLKVNIDASNYKGHKIDNIEYQTKKICRDVMKTKVEVKMDPMNSYERRAVHNAASKFKNIETESFGEEPNRYVVIRYKESEQVEKENSEE